MKPCQKIANTALLLCTTGSFFASAGQWSISPSLTAHSHAVKINSQQDALRKDELVYGANTTIDGRYEGPWLAGSAAWEHTMYRYTASKEAALSLHEYALVLETGPASEQFEMRLTWDRQRDLFNTVRGSFSDETFATDNGFVADDHDMLLRYQNPHTWSIDTVLRWLRHDNKTESEDGRQSYRYEIDTWNASLGQFTGDPSLYWRIDQEWQHTDRNQTQKYQSIDREAELSIPVAMDKHLRAVATHQYSDYKNPALGDLLLGASGAQYESWGLGVSWRSLSRKTSVALTRDLDVARDSYYWSGKFRYMPNRESYIEMGKTKKFFGASTLLSAAYQYKEFRFRASHDDDVSLQYLLSPMTFLTGIYHCTSADMDSIDRCVRIEDLNQPVPNGSVVRPVFETLFPLADRLSLNKDSIVSVSYQGLRWTSDLTFRRNRMLDIEYGLAQDSDEAAYELIRGKGRKFEYAAVWKFRSKSLQPSGLESHERLYGLSFQHNLNRHAFWKVGIQHINQQTSSGQYDYRDNRISLSYTHHFGDRNKNILSQPTE